MIEKKSLIGIKVNIAGLNAVVNSMLKLQSLQVRRRAIAAGGLEAVTEIQKYYQNKGREPWINPTLPTHGTGRKLTQWWRGTERWSMSNPTSKSVTFSNNYTGLSHKITGGTIRAKRKKFLTIPVDPRAHGLRAKDFGRNIAPLFLVKGALAMKEDDGTITNIYLLRKSVHHEPWPDAWPNEQKYTAAFMDGLTYVLMDEAQNGKQ